MGVRRVLHGRSSETQRLFTVKINFVRDAIRVKICRVKARCLPYKFFSVLLDVPLECVWNFRTLRLLDKYALCSGFACDIAIIICYMRAFFRHINDLLSSVFINSPGAVDITVLVKLLEGWLIEP